MAVLSNAHTHTTFCDGKNTAEEMVQAAVKAGFHCLGFSGHSVTPIDPEFDYPEEVIKGYQAEVKRLKEAYQGQIDVVLGLEWDYYGVMNRQDYQYIIGSAHYLKSPLSGKAYTVDHTHDKLELCIREGFEGDSLAMVKAYYDIVTDIAEQVKPDILGHFDLIKKLNEEGRHFDESASSYKRIAEAALERVVKADALVEINTGAMYRGYRSEPYPAPWMLGVIRELDGRVMISSDSHDVRSIDYQFEAMEALVKELGFREIWALSGEGIRPQEL